MPERQFPFRFKERDIQSLPPQCSSQCCTGIISKPFKHHSTSGMDPLSTTASGIAVANVVVKTASAIRKFRAGYRDADKEALHAYSQREQLQTNKSGLLDLPAELRQSVFQVQDSLPAIETSLPSEAPSGRKRDRLRWVIKNREPVVNSISRLKNTEASLNLTLILAALKRM